MTATHRRTLTVTTSLLLAACASTEEVRVERDLSEDELVELARGIHERAITLDTHDDISVLDFTPERNYTTDLGSQVNLPKMRAGGLDVAWFVVYTGQGSLDDAGYAKAYETAMTKFDAIHRLCDELAPDEIELALTAEDVRRIDASGKKVAMIGVENGYPLGLDLANIEKFHGLGARYLSLAHQGHSQFADSNTGERDNVWLHGGLSELGREAVRELNRVGIIIDISHPSRDAVLEMCELTRAPVAGSHSAARALNDVSRNHTDEELLAIKETGGVVQAVAFKSYVDKEKNDAYRDATRTLRQEARDELGFEGLSSARRRSMSDEERARYERQRDEVDELIKDKMKELEKTTPPVDVADFVDHIDYMVNLIGIDHVGISSDFGGGGGVSGWNDASETFNVTLELVRRGYTERSIEKLWSGNWLRVLDEVQRVAAEIQTEG